MRNKYLTKISSDLQIATQSKKEEEQAIKDYTERLKSAKSPLLVKALTHARKEERDHNREFQEVIEKEAGGKGPYGAGSSLIEMYIHRPTLGKKEKKRE